MSTNILTINKENGITFGGESKSLQAFAGAGFRGFQNFKESVVTSKEEDSDENLGFYIHEFEGIKLFSQQDISDLALQIEDAKTEINVIKTDILSVQSEKSSLAREIKEIEAKIHEAKQSLVNTHLRVVFAVAKKNINRGLSFLELIQAGKLGLEKAVDTYESCQGLDIFAYAVFWIRLSIARAIVEHRKSIAKLEVNESNVIAFGKRTQDKMV